MDYVRETVDLVDESDVLVRAIVPEPKRRQRLEAEAEALRRRYPEPGSFSRHIVRRSVETGAHTTKTEFFVNSALLNAKVNETPLGQSQVR